jgi:hypothetical protein
MRTYGPPPAFDREIEEGGRVARELLQISDEQTVERFATAFARIGTSGGAAFAAPLPAGVSAILVFPDLSWRQVRRLAPGLTRSILVRTVPGRIWSVKTPAYLDSGEPFLAQLCARLVRASAGPRRWEHLGRRLSSELIPVRIFDSRLDDPLAPEWELAEATRAITYATVGEAVPWYRAKNLAAVHQMLADRVRAGFARALERFVDDPPGWLGVEAPPACSLTVSHCNFLRDGRSDVSRNRIQFARLFPLFLPALAGTEESDSKFMAEIASIIDQGRPFVRAVAALLHVKPEAVRFVRGLTIENVGMQWAGKPQTLIQSVAVVPPERRPRTTEEWQWFGRAARALSLIADQSGFPPLQRTWLREVARQGFDAKSNLILDRLVRPNQARAAGDFIKALREALDHIVSDAGDGNGIPPRERERRARIALCSSLEILALQRLFALSDTWHDRLGALQADDRRALAGDGSGGWKSIVESPVRIGEYHVEPLRSESALRAEALRMNNCLVQYATMAWALESLLFSVRDRSDRSLSTFELSLEPGHGRPGISLVQHAGWRNSEPPPACDEVVAAFLAYVAAEVPASRLNQLRDLRRLRAAMLQQAPGEARRMLLIVESLRGILPEGLNLERLALQAMSPPARPG